MSGSLYIPVLIFPATKESSLLLVVSMSQKPLHSCSWSLMIQPIILISSNSFYDWSPFGIYRIPWADALYNVLAKSHSTIVTVNVSLCCSKSYRIPLPNRKHHNCGNATSFQFSDLSWSVNTLVLGRGHFLYVFCQ